VFSAKKIKSFSRPGDLLGDHCCLFLLDQTKPKIEKSSFVGFLFLVPATLGYDRLSLISQLRSSQEETIKQSQ
jgi:hypothetical protein